MCASDGVKRFNKWLDARPVTANALLLCTALPLVSLMVAMRPILSAAVLRQGAVMFAAYQAVRITAEWLASLYTSFNYVQVAAVSKLEAEKKWSSAGAYLIFSSALALFLGLVTMVVLMAAAEPLLRALSPTTGDIKDVGTVLSVGLTAQIVVAVFIPARVMISVTTGFGLAQSASSVLLVGVTYAIVAGCIIVAVVVQIVICVNTGCEDQIKAANASAYANATAAGYTIVGGIQYASAAAAANASAVDSSSSSSLPHGGQKVFDSEKWICPEAEVALTSTALTESVLEWMAAIGLLIMITLIGKQRGYFKEHGCNLGAYLKLGTSKGSREGSGVGDDGSGGSGSGSGSSDRRDLRKGMCRGGAGWRFLRDNLGVMLRSVLNNTRDYVSPVIALQMTVTKAAVFLFFEEIGTFSYAVPNVCSIGAAMIGSRLLGQGRTRKFKQLMDLHRAFALLCAVAFTILTAATQDQAIESFTNEVDRDALKTEADLAYKMAIALQPFRSLTGVYGWMMMATQQYVAWGLIVSVAFFCVYLPMTIVAGAQESVELLLAAQVAFNVCHFVCLYYTVHFRAIPAILKRGDTGYPGGDPAAVHGDGGGGDADRDSDSGAAVRALERTGSSSAVVDANTSSLELLDKSKAPTTPNGVKGSGGETESAV